jgi:hypothetical protein
VGRTPNGESRDHCLLPHRTLPMAARARALAGSEGVASRDFRTLAHRPGVSRHIVIVRCRFAGGGRLPRTPSRIA